VCFTSACASSCKQGISLRWRRLRGKSWRDVAWRSNGAMAAEKRVMSSGSDD